MTTDSERRIQEKYEALGYRVLHKGAPDFLLLKDGEPPQFCEVKSKGARATPEQREWIRALKSLGAKAFVEKPSRPRKGITLTFAVRPSTKKRIYTLYRAWRAGRTRSQSKEWGEFIDYMTDQANL